MSGWVEVVLEVLPYVYSAYSGYTKNKEQSEMEAESALANSMAIKSSGAYNAKSFLAMSALNSQLGMLGAEAENMRIRAITDNNIKTKLFLTNYESSLLENEAMLVGEAAELDLKQLQRKHNQAIGDMRTSQASSGAIIDQDSPAIAVEDAKQQQELERFIIRRGADIQMAKLMDKAAYGRWEAGLEATSMAMEGRLLENSNIVGGMLKGFGMSAQGSIDAGAMLYNSGINANQAMITGQQKSDAYDSQASTSFWNGVFGAGTTVGKNYVKSKEEDDSTTNDSLLVEGNSTDPYANQGW